MSLVRTAEKVGIACNGCRIQRWWPQGFHGVFNTLQELQDFASKRWGWTFDWEDLCGECSTKKDTA